MNHASACVPWCQPQSWGGGWRQSGSCRGRTLEVCWCPGWGQIAQLSPESQSCPPSSEMFSMTPGLQWLEACLIPATHTVNIFIILPCCHTAVHASHVLQVFFPFTLFTWLAVVLVDMEVGSRLVVLRLLFKLFMISRFFAFSARVQKLLKMLFCLLCMSAKVIRINQ